jgi:hypothetical protein
LASSSPGFDPTRVKIITEDSVVYLMGLVSPAEAEAATEVVRYVPGVQRVVKLFEYISRPTAELSPGMRADLDRIAGPGRLLTDPADCWAYGYDNSRRHALPRAVIFASDDDQIMALVHVLSMNTGPP